MKAKILLVFLLLVYLCLLLININKTPLFVGDENKYWTSVQYMMDGKIDRNNHPLLAKTIWLGVVNSFYIFTGTDKPVFWRFGTIIFSLLSLVVFYKVLRIFFSNNISLISTTLLAVDPMFFVFSRSLQLEIIMIFWLLLSLYLFIVFLRTGNLRKSLLGAFFLGLSLATKLSALLVVILVPVFLFFAVREKKNMKIYIRNTLLFYSIVIVAFLLGNIVFLIFTKNPIQFISYCWALIVEQFGNIYPINIYQTSLPSTWFFIPQILSMYRVSLLDRVSSVLVFQNPALFLVSGFTVIMTFLGLVAKNGKNKKETALFLVYFIGLYLPWFLNIRETYYYYALPLIPLVIFLFIKLIYGTRYFKLILASVLALSVFAFFVYFPLLTGFEVPKVYDLVLYRYSQYKYPDINLLFCQSCFPRR